MKRIAVLWTAIDSITASDTQHLSPDDNRTFIQIKYNLSLVIDRVNDIINLFVPIMKLSPCFGSENSYTFSFKKFFVKSVKSHIDSYIASERSSEVASISSTILESLKKRMENIEETSVQQPNSAERIFAEHLETAAQMLDPATAYDWINSGESMDKLFAGLLAALYSSHQPEEAQGEQSNEYQVLQSKIDELRNESNRMGLDASANDTLVQFLKKAKIAEYEALMRRLLSPYGDDSGWETKIREALAGEVETYAMEIYAQGKGWQEKCGDLNMINSASSNSAHSAGASYRYRHWPDRSEKFPLLATAAFTLLSMMSANTVTERANSAARHVMGRLRSRLSTENLEMLVVAYKSSKRKNGVPSVTTTDLEDLINSGRVRRNDSGSLEDSEEFDSIFDLEDQEHPGDL